MQVFIYGGQMAREINKVNVPDTGITLTGTPTRGINQLITTFSVNIGAGTEYLKGNNELTVLQKVN